MISINSNIKLIIIKINVKYLNADKVQILQAPAQEYSSIPD